MRLPKFLLACGILIGSSCHTDEEQKNDRTASDTSKVNTDEAIMALDIFDLPSDAPADVVKAFDDMKKVVPELVEAIVDYNDAVDEAVNVWDELHKLRLSQQTACANYAKLSDEYLAAVTKTQARWSHVQSVRQTFESLYLFIARHSLSGASAATRLIINQQLKAFAKRASGVLARFAPVVGWLMFLGDMYDLGSVIGDKGLFGQVAQASEPIRLNDFNCFDYVRDFLNLQADWIKKYGISASSAFDQATYDREKHKLLVLMADVQECQRAGLGPWKSEENDYGSQEAVDRIIKEMSCSSDSGYSDGSGGYGGSGGY